MSGNQLINDTSLTRVMEFGESKGVRSCAIVMLKLTIEFNFQFFRTMAGLTDPMMEQAHRAHVL